MVSRLGLGTGLVVCVLLLASCGSSERGSAPGAGGTDGSGGVDSGGTGGDGGTGGGGRGAGGTGSGGEAGAGASSGVGGSSTTQAGGAAGSAGLDGTGGAGGSGGQPPQPVEDVREVFGSVCDFLDRCEAFQLAVDSRDECIDVLEFLATCDLEVSGSSARPIFELEHIPLAYTPELGGTCVGWLESADCSALQTSGNTPCTEAIGLTLNASDSSSSDSSSGSSTRTARLGEECSNTPCATGLDCPYFDNDAGTLPYCQVCEAPALEGERCAFQDRTERACAAGLECNSDTGLCTPLPEAGEPCTFFCASGLYCDSDSSRCTEKKKESETCDADGECVEGLVCHTDVQSCGAPRTQDEPCSRVQHCQQGLLCHMDTRLCGAPRAAGQPCEDGTQCQSGFCSRVSDSCDAGGATGDPCQVPFDCREGFVCDSVESVCFAPGPGGADCARDEHCESGYCDPEASVCGLPLGSACDSNLDCAGNYCLPDLSLGVPGYPGTCDQPLEEGEPCSLTSQFTECAEVLECRRVGASSSSAVCTLPCTKETPCEVGFYCDSGLVLQSGGGTCHPMLENGESCSHDVQCDSGLCNVAGFCGPLRALGEGCTDSLECELGAYCSNQLCEPRLPPGAECSGYDSCLMPAACIDGVCTKINLECSPAPIGERCALLAVCEAGAYCNALQGFTCQALRQPGESCAMNNDCGPDHHCAFAGSGDTGFVCTLSSDIDQPCDSDQRCRLGTWCDPGSSLCAPQLPDGEPCPSGSDEQCESGECNGDDLCGDPSACVPYP